MKIAYVLSWEFRQLDGVSQKILSQIRAWKANGIEVSVFCMSYDETQYVEEVSVYKKTALSKVIRNNKLLKDIQKYDPDIVYYRYEGYNPTFNYVAKKYPIVCEINSLIAQELKLHFNKQPKIKNWFRKFIFRLIGNRVFTHTNGVVGVTEELAQVPPHVKNRIAIPNSIDISKYPVIEKKVEDRIVKFIFLASRFQAWHGVDIFKELINKLGPSVEGIVIGGDTKVPTKEGKIAYYPFMKKEDYLVKASECHFGVGSLGMFRNNIIEATPLKVREYLALGLPIIIGYSDTAFLHEKPEWVFQIPVDELQNKISDNMVKQLSCFIDQYKQKIVTHEESAKFIDSRILEKRRIEFFKEIIGDSE